MDNFTTLAAMVQHMVNTYQNSSALNYPTEDGWDRMSTETFAQNIRRLALGLHDLGLERGQTVGIIASPSPWWCIADLGIMSAGGVSVPLFPHISRKNFEYEITNANIKHLVVIGSDNWAALSGFHERFEYLITCQIDDNEGFTNVLTMKEVMERGDAASGRNPSLYADLREQIHEDDLCTIIYTSGCTGTPKGVELTHRNLVSQVLGCQIRMPIDPTKDRVLSLLPLAHVFERMLMYSYLSQGAAIYFVDDLYRLMDLCQQVKPTLSAMVPLVVEKIYWGVAGKIQKAALPIRLLGQWALKVGCQPPEGFWRRLLLNIFYRLVYKKIRDQMGGHYRGIIVGGAPLSKEMYYFFHNCGVELYQGYGLTEAAPVLATNYPDHNKAGTVGPIFPYVEVKLGEQDEIIARGPNIMRGYHKDPEATEKVLDSEGWLHTGDQGHLDEHGFLSIVGRIKEIMKTSAGKMVTPVPIEQMLCKSLLVDQAVVIANERNYVTAVLFPNFEQLKRMKHKLKMDHLSHEDFLDSRQVREEVAKLLEKVNKRVNAWEKVKAARFVSAPPSIEDGDMTPTLKINRENVAKKYKDLIDSMY